MKHTTPERALAKFWQRAEVEFWTTMAFNAPSQRHYNLYAAKAALVNQPEKVIPNGERLHLAVKGVLMFCPACQTGYADCHPTEPAYCALNHAPAQVRPAKHVLAVSDAVTRHFVKNKLF